MAKKRVGFIGAGIMSIAEGLAYAEKAGLDLETTLKVTFAGAAGSHSLKALGPKIIAGDLILQRHFSSRILGG